MGPIHLYGKNDDPYAFVAALYIFMGKILRIHILDISIIHLNRNLMMSIWALRRHKLAK